MENTGIAAEVIQLDLTTEVTATTVGTAHLPGVVLPLLSETFAASARDVETDFDGSAGMSFVSPEASDFATLRSTGAAMDEFIGFGRIDIFIAADTFFVVTPGSETIDPDFTALAGAQTEVTCNFGDDPAVIPIPAGFPLLLAGIGAFCALRRRQRADAEG